MRQVIHYTLVILITVAAAVLLYQFRSLLVLLVISLALTASCRPALTFLGRIRVPGFLAQLVILIVLLGVVFGVIVLIGPSLMTELQRLTNYSLVQYQSMYQVWEAGQSWQQMIASSLPEPGSLVDYFLGTGGELILPTAINLTQNLAGFISKLFIVLTISLYLAQDQDHLIRRWLSVIPSQQRMPVRSTWQEVETAIGQYLRHEMALALFASAFLGFGYALLGLQYPIALALLAFIGWFIPLLGFAVILIPVFLTSMGSGWGLVFVAISFTLVVLLGLKYWLIPKYLHPVRYSSFLIVFWIVVLGNFLGPGGYLAGPVVAVASQTIWGQYLIYRSRPEQARIQMVALKERFAMAYDEYRQINDVHPSPYLGSLFERLLHSLNQTEQLSKEHHSGD